jgi:hypothetical protein
MAGAIIPEVTHVRPSAVVAPATVLGRNIVVDLGAERREDGFAEGEDHHGDRARENREERRVGEREKKSFKR